MASKYVIIQLVNLSGQLDLKNFSLLWFESSLRNDGMNVLLNRRSSPRGVAFALAASTLLAPGSALAQGSVEDELNALRDRIADLESRLGEGAEASTWMSEQRAAEVRTVVDAALSDPTVQSSFGGGNSGYDGKNFFLSSPDGRFRVRFSSQLQFRWLGNSQSDRSDEFDDGFQLRRLKFGARGELGYDAPVSFKLVVQHNASTGAVIVDVAYVDFALDDVAEGLVFRVGKDKLPFLRREIISSTRQLSVDRSLSTEFFTLDRAEMISLNYTADSWRGQVALSDGADTEETTIGADPADFAVTARGELRLAGDWKQATETIAWLGDPQSIVLGGAVHYEIGDGDSNGAGATGVQGDGDYFGYTVDASYMQDGLSLYGAFMGGHISPDDGLVLAAEDFLGVLVDASYNLNDELAPFVRYEYIDNDSANAVQAVTLGANYFLDGHRLKVTGDVVWVYDGDFSSNPFGNSISSSGLGFPGGTLNASADDVVIFRLQLQMTF